MRTMVRYRPARTSAASVDIGESFRSRNRDTSKISDRSTGENAVDPASTRVCRVSGLPSRSDRSTLPANAYYGVQTQRGMDNFRITGMPMSTEP
jgi:hypothetical protein